MPDWEEFMPRLEGFSRFAALLEEQLAKSGLRRARSVSLVLCPRNYQRPPFIDEGTDLLARQRHSARRFEA
jgi:hypothetical protein